MNHSKAIKNRTVDRLDDWRAAQWRKVDRAMEARRELEQAIGMPTCSFCGHIGVPGDAVILSNNYIGGQGYVRQIECYDRERCSERRDAAHVITQTEGVEKG